MEIITGVERRRRWTLEEKLRIVAETEQPGAGIAEIARRYEISRGLLWNWRSQVRRGVLMAEPPQVFREKEKEEREKGNPAARLRSRCPTEHRSRLGTTLAW